MPEARPEEWQEIPDLPTAEPAPADWAPPVPLETRIEAGPGIAVQDEETALRRQRRSRRRRFWTTTSVFLALYVASLLTVDTAGNPFVILVLLVPVYLLTLPFVLHTPKHVKGRKQPLLEQVDWLTRLMTGVVVFLILYIPFTFFSNEFIPFASIVEYLIFALLLFIILRVAGRAAGVAPSADALPPPTHRLHRQVVAPIDDVHYQRTLFLNYAFVERGRGSKDLAKRVEQVLAENGVPDQRRNEILRELYDYRDASGFSFLRRSRQGRATDRDRRTRLLDTLFVKIRQELENIA